MILTTQWQCTNCKTCVICEEANPEEDEQMLFCDSCDLGYHMSCHFPPIFSKPSGNWACNTCKPKKANKKTAMLPPKTINSKARGRNGSTDSKSAIFEFVSRFLIIHFSEPIAANGSRRANSADEQLQPGLDDHSRFLPILPPHLHPHTGFLPKNWEEFPTDHSIPDVTDWEPNQVSTYFANQGFPPEQAGVFVREVIFEIVLIFWETKKIYNFFQEIDGKSLLLLHRQDVTGSLGLRLGPALKIFNHVKKLQTRKNFSST